MKKPVLSIAVGFSLLIFGLSAAATEGVVSIPLNTFIKPAFNLVDQNGKWLSTADLEAIYRKNKSIEDLSRLNPIEDNYWQDKKYSATDLELHAEMPGLTDTVVFDDYIGTVRDLGISSIFIHPTHKPNVRYALTFGLNIHASLAKAALLRKMGFYQESPKYFKSITLKFSSKDQMAKFVARTFCEEGPSSVNIDCLSLEPFKRKFITDMNEQNNSLVLHGAYLEKMNPNVPGLFDGLTPANVNTLPEFASHRAFRSLIVPFAVGDLGESLNRASPQSVEIRGEWAEINFFNSIYFDGKTMHDDVQWALRRMAKLTDADWDEIVEASGYPKSLQTLVRTKLIMRMTNLIESVFKKEEWPTLIQVKVTPLKQINSTDGVVVAGKVMTQEIPGYPQRFSHGERQSPFETADLIKYMSVKAQSSAIQVGLNQLGQKLLVNRQKVAVEGFKLTDTGITPVGNVSAINAGVNFTANRIISTGTYYGSDAPIQMVDTISLTAGIGYNRLQFLTGGITSNFGANLGYVRSYTHVRPLDKIAQVKEEKWSNLYVPSHLGKLTSPLKDGKLSEFLLALKIGEVFTITDSVGIMGRVGANAAIDALVGFTSIGSPTASLSVDASGVLLRQVQFSRTADGLQIYVRNGNTKAFGVQFDVNYFINLMRIRSQTAKADLHTSAYLLDYNAEFMAGVEKGDFNVGGDVELQKKLDEQAALAEPASKTVRHLIFKSAKAFSVIRDIFFQSSTERLEHNFSENRYDIDHKLKTKEIQSKILWHRASKLDEEHLLTLTAPVIHVPEGSTAKNVPIRLAIHRKGELRGSDYLGFGLDVTDGVLAHHAKQYAPSLAQASQNPSQMPFGQAEWRMIRSDTELSQDRFGALPSVSIIEHVWGGWSLSRSQLDKILETVKANVKETKFADYPLIPDGALQHVKKIDFFRVTSHLTLLPTAIDKVKDLVLAPDAANQPVEKAKFVSRFFQKLSEMGGNKASSQDQAIFKNLMRIFGNGDENVGYQKYLAECRMKQINEKQSQASSAWLKGTNYECLEPWIEKIISLSRKYPQTDLRTRNRWMTEVLYVLDEKIPQVYLLNELGKENFIYYVEIVGFRSGDEDADKPIFTSNVLGAPEKRAEYANGLINILSRATRISAPELERSQGGF